jgi:hypothetical protein
VIGILCGRTTTSAPPRFTAEPRRPPYAYNFGNPFSGTHFGAPRTATVSLEVTIR